DSLSHDVPFVTFKKVSRLARKISYKPPRVVATPAPEPIDAADPALADEEAEVAEVPEPIVAGPLTIVIEEGAASERLDAA
ncbi:hypothetical protein ABTA59_19610, partial [Acinetobacter baumannii]